MARRRLFNRIFTGFLLIAVLYNLLFAGYFYISGRSSIENNVNQQDRSILTQVAEGADMILYNARDMVSRLAADEKVIAFAAGSSEGVITDYVSSAISVNLGALSEKGYNIYVTRLEGPFGIAVGRENTVNVYAMLNSLGFIDGTGGEIRNFFSDADNEGRTFVRYFEKTAQRNASRLVAVQQKLCGGVPLYFVSVFDLDSLFALSQLGGRTLMLLDGRSIVLNTSADMTDAYMQLGELIGQVGDVVSLRDRTMERGNYLFDTAHSPINDWHFVLATPTAQRDAQIAQLALSTLAVWAMLFLVSLFVIYILARLTYKPLGKLMGTLSNYGGGQHYDEVRCVEDILGQAYRDNKELKDSIALTRPPLRTKFIGDLLSGLAEQQDIDAMIPKDVQSRLEAPFRVAVLEFSNYSLLQEVFSREAIGSIREQIHTFIEEQLAGRILYEVLQTDYRRFAFIICGGRLEDLRQSLMQAVMMVEGSFEVEMACAIGDGVDSLLDVAESHRSAVHVLENQFSVGGRNAVVTSEEMQAANAEGFYYPLDVERELISDVLRLRQEEVHRLLTEILDENLKRRTLTKDRLNALVFAITATINRIIESANKTAEDVFGEGNIVFLDLKMCQGPKQLRQKVVETFDSLIAYFQTDGAAGAGEGESLADALLDYIHSNYNKDISLLDIGGHFNLSQCYISTLFKDTTGENFKDYLSRYRIKKAKEILKLDPTIKSRELAQQIGCNTVATLFRLFNKYEGMSPGQYVKSLNRA